MKTGTLTIAVALATLWAGLTAAETIVVDDQVQVRPPRSPARPVARP